MLVYFVERRQYLETLNDVEGFYWLEEKTREKKNIGVPSKQKIDPEERREEEKEGVCVQGERERSRERERERERESFF